MSVGRSREERLEVRLAETLANRREFPLSTKQYDAFVAALDAAPKRKPRLARLLNTPGVLEE